MQKLSITRIHKHTPDVWSFFMHPKPAFIAGQVAVLGMNGYKSSYLAFASAPEDEECEFLVKASDNETTFAYGLFNHHQSQVTLENVVGNGFAIEQQLGSDLLFLAMGTGLAPLRSVLRHIFHRRADFGKLVVVHGVRSNKDFFFEHEINNEWRIHDVALHQIISQPVIEWNGHTGYVQSLLEKILPDLHAPAVLISGSQEMMKQTTERLRELGIAGEKILTNY
jgi:NAD(P)H-flavin reductase